MYIISIVALVVAITLMASISGAGTIVYFIDLPSIILLVLITFPILFSTGLLKDFGKSFRIVLVKNKEISLIQLKKSLEAISLAIKSNLYAGGLIVLFAFVLVLINIDSFEVLGPNLAVAILPLAYAFAINIILISIKYKLKLMILNFTQD